MAQIDGAENITRTFGESVSMTGTYSDNWQVVSVKWYLGDILVLTDPSPQKQGTSSLILEIGSLEILRRNSPCSHGDNGCQWNDVKLYVESYCV